MHKEKKMILSTIQDKIIKQIGMTKSKSNIVRSGMSANNLIPQSKYIAHIDDLLLLTYCHFLPPLSHSVAKEHYRKLLPYRSEIVKALRVIYANLHKIENVTFGYYYIIVNYKNDPFMDTYARSFLVGKMIDPILDRSRTLDQNKVIKLFKIITNC